jgi:hypothetical protein
LFKIDRRIAQMSLFFLVRSMMFVYIVMSMNLVESYLVNIEIRIKLLRKSNFQNDDLRLCIEDSRQIMVIIDEIMEIIKNEIQN